MLKHLPSAKIIYGFIFLHEKDAIHWPQRPRWIASPIVIPARNSWWIAYWRLDINLYPKCARVQPLADKLLAFILNKIISDAAWNHATNALRTALTGWAVKRWERAESHCSNSARNIYAMTHALIIAMNRGPSRKTVKWCAKGVGLYAVLRSAYQRRLSSSCKITRWM